MPAPQSPGRGDRTSLPATCRLAIAVSASTARDIGITREALPDLAAHSMEDWFLHLNPRKLASAEELVAVLEAAW